MTAFPERVDLLELLLEQRRSKAEGGWPNKLHLENSATTIVATAQVLEILRIRGDAHRGDAVRSGLKYLATSVERQTQPGARGEWTRFPAYALWGLMRYPAALRDPALARGAVFSYMWLEKAARRDGGWTQLRRPAKDDPMSLPVTMVAAHALERFAIYTRDRRGRAEALVNEARDEIARAAEGRTSQRWWAQVPGEEKCPGATCLAVLTLARGEDRHRECARRGIAWLAANPEMWTDQVHYDDHIESRTWRIFSFSLGLRALLHPCAPRAVNDPTIGKVIKHCYKIWNNEEGGWSDRPGGNATTAGSYAVVSATHALKRAWPFDPAEMLGLQPPPGSRAAHRPRPLRILYVCEPERTIRVTTERDELLVESKIAGKSQWTILKALSKRLDSAARKGSNDQTEQTMSLADLAELCGDGETSTQPESARKTIERLNLKLKQKAAERGVRNFVDLIEDHFPPGTNEKWAALEEIEVRFVDSLPQPGADTGD
jgi:hypothetical protein